MSQAPMADPVQPSIVGTSCSASIADVRSACHISSVIYQANPEIIQ
jgi:hypothetical protein